MKKNILFNIISVLQICFIVVFLLSCNSNEMKKYYSDRNNYLDATGIITHMSYDETNCSLYLEFSDLNPEFDDTCFKLVGNNFLIAQKNGINQKIQKGDQVDFVTAPKYFGDGYVMPIVALSVDGEALLSFEDGYKNWLEWLN